ncbi:MAG: Ig-like domain-containing protein [Candidatus Zixiibacteriota bacterium]
MRRTVSILFCVFGALLLVLGWLACSGDVNVTTAPEIVWTYPPAGATHVRVTDDIMVGFSRHMDSASINTATFFVDHDVGGTRTYSGTMAQFTPERDLEFNTTYTVTITTGVRDEDGIPLEDAHVWSFTTRPPPPRVTDLVPTSGQAGDTIMIQGLNFSPSPAGNMVRFSSTPPASGSAPIIEANSAYLVVEVPYGAITGPVTVSTAGGAATSADIFHVIHPGTIWEAAPSGTGSSLNNVAWLTDRFVAVGGQGTILTSFDGLEWVSHESGTLSSLHGAARSEIRIVVVGSNGLILTSSGGINWIATSSGSIQPLRAITWTGSRFVAVGGNGLILGSADGFDWEERNSGTLDWLFGVASKNQTVVACGLNGTIVTSTDNGSFWSVVPSGIDETLLDLSVVDDQFIVVGHRGTVLLSSDGATWAPSATGTTKHLGGVTSGDTPGGPRIVAVGEEGTILTSPDGTQWAQQQSPSVNDLFAVTWNGRKYVAVGSGGVILVSR